MTNFFTSTISDLLINPDYVEKTMCEKVEKRFSVSRDLPVEFIMDTNTLFLLKSGKLATKYIYSIEESMQNVFESLMTTYDSNQFIKAIHKLFADDVFQITEPQMPSQIPSNLFTNKYGTIFGFVVVLRDVDRVDIKVKDFQHLCETYGYFIVSESEQTFNTVKTRVITLEPKYPVVINSLLNPNIQYVYHITNKKNITKIKKRGLIPRTTQTTYQFGENRIYLIINAFKPDIYQLGRLIAQNRKEKIDDYVILKIKFNRAAHRYYIDQTSFTVEEGHYLLGVFVKEGIPSSEIVDIFPLKSLNN